MQLIQTVAPTSEPLSLDDAKDFMRIVDSSDDSIIETMITAAREQVEEATHRQLMPATYELISSCFIDKLPKNPIQSVEKIEYMDLNGDYQLLDTSNYYLFEKYGIGRIKYSNLPKIMNHEKAVKITFITGYPEVPKALIQYMKVRVSTFYENREQFVIGANISEFGTSFIENLLSPYKIRNI